MFVINRIELVTFHQPIEVRKFHGDDAIRLEKNFHSSDKVIQVGHMRQHVVAEQQIRLTRFLRDNAR